MSLTKNIALDALTGYHYTSNIPQKSQTKYTWVSILPQSPSEMSRSYLYVCRLSEAMSINARMPGFHYICVRDCPTDAAENETALNGIVVIEDDVELKTVYARLQERFRQVGDWTAQLQSALLSDCDYQQLIDLAEPVLQNVISVVDTAFTLVAHTKNSGTGDEIMSALFEKGYHSEDVLQAFQSAGRFKVYSEEMGIMVNPGAPSRYPTVSRWFRYGGTPMLFVVMLCNRRDATPCLVDLFQIFLDAFSVCFQRKQRAGATTVQIYDSLMTDMLYGNLTDRAVIWERAKCVNIPIKGYYNVYKIVFRGDGRMAAGRLKRELMSLFPEARIVMENFEIVILNSYRTPKVQEASAANIEQIRQSLTTFDALCGISETFEDFYGLRRAYEQAGRAVSLGERLSKSENFLDFAPGVRDRILPKRDKQVFYYGDFCIYQLIETGLDGSFDVFWGNPYVRALSRLQAYDRKHKSNNTQILYVYLLSERRTTTAGELLCMHRNNIQYHINKIQEMLGVDLNNRETQLGFQLAFRFWELHHSKD